MAPSRVPCISTAAVPFVFAFSCAGRRPANPDMAMVSIVRMIIGSISAIRIFIVGGTIMVMMLMLVVAMMVEICLLSSFRMIMPRHSRWRWQWPRIGIVGTTLLLCFIGPIGFCSKPPADHIMIIVPPSESSSTANLSCIVRSSCTVFRRVWDIVVPVSIHSGGWHNDISMSAIDVVVAPASAWGPHHPMAGPQGLGSSCSGGRG
mmetsp:Transcript_28807/g.63435  ORF Transcript_28807/g.63435 Transcript_28807/m.63435 type:complete len:205 (-) Transcript_28807:1241-1855(-)